MEKKIKVFAVCGPTAAGKTALAAELAKALSGEVVSCDSMQIYRGMEIGTAKPTEAEMLGIPHHLIGFLEPTERFSVMDYVTRAKEMIEEINARGNPVFLAGGTGLYARSLLNGVPFSERGSDDGLRTALWVEFERDGIEPLFARLRELDPVSAESIHPNNTKRVLRALEYCLSAGEPFSAQTAASKAVEPPYDSKMLCIGYRDRGKLYARIDRRVDAMMEAGLLEEARAYYEKVGANPGTSAQAIGYKELFPYFEGTCSLEEAVARIKQETRRYAKRQLTWFRREENAVWLYADDYEDFSALVSAALPLAKAHFERRERL